MRFRQENSYPPLKSVYLKARRRAGQISNNQALDWLDSAAVGISKAVQDYRTFGSIDSLLEIQRASAQIDGLIEVIVTRGK